MAKYATATNQNPVECNVFNEGISKAEVIYGDYRGKEVTFGMGSKTPVFSLDIKKNLLINARAAFDTLNTSAKPKLDQLKSI